MLVPEMKVDVALLGAALVYDVGVRPPGMMVAGV